MVVQASNHLVYKWGTQKKKKKKKKKKTDRLVWKRSDGAAVV